VTSSADDEAVAAPERVHRPARGFPPRAARADSAAPPAPPPPGPVGDRAHVLDRSGELDRILEQAQVEDVVVDAMTTSIRSTAEAVMAAVGW
jgi:hypothetical protein